MRVRVAREKDGAGREIICLLMEGAVLVGTVTHLWMDQWWLYETNHSLRLSKKEKEALHEW